MFMVSSKFGFKRDTLVFTLYLEVHGWSLLGVNLASQVLNIGPWQIGRFFTELERQSRSDRALLLWPLHGVGPSLDKAQP